ncbi:MAG: hypothetical protein DME08_10925 [Candidatus Rokuibacteriota bacterium]|nr:MAG: hypothetical protein DME08_10925 [Candidatus Rokubacteria bacterium]
MTGTGTIGTRQQVERWIEESQYLLGRVIPSVFDDNQRLRERAAASDAECDRMREEIATVRRELHEVQLELSGLRGQNDDLRSQQAAVAESLSRAVHHMTELMQPMNEMALPNPPLHAFRDNGGRLREIVLRPWEFWKRKLLSR